MNAKSLIWIGVFVGSTVGGLIPALWGGGVFGLSSILWSTIGGIAGIWAGFKISRLV